MACETLEEKKSEEEASPVKEMAGSKVEEQPQDANKDEEKENKEVPEKVASNEDKENQVPERIDVEDKHDERVVARPQGEDEEVDKEEKEEEHHEEDGKEEEKEETPDKPMREGQSDYSGKQKEFSGKKKSKESADEKEKEPVSTRGDRPTRERKAVELYSMQQPSGSATKPVSIEKGRGTQLKDIPNVAFKLSKRKPDRNLQTLHTILYGKKAKARDLKKNIGQFSGYVWAENEEKQRAKTREKIDKCGREKLLDFCNVLNIRLKKAFARKEEFTVKLLEFLESPHATTDVLLAEKKQKGKKRKARPRKSASPSEDSTPPAKKGKKQKAKQGKGASPGEDSTPPAKKRKYTRQENLKRSLKFDMDEDEDKYDSPETKDSKNDSEVVNDESDVQKEESDQEEEEDEPKEQPSTKKASKKGLKENSGTKNKENGSRAKSGNASTKKSSDSPVKEEKIEKESPKEKITPNKDNMGFGKLPSKACLQSLLKI